MAILRIAALLAASFACTSPAIAADETELTKTARMFLEAFATKPSATEALVTSDAVAAVGDIGGPFSQFLREVRPKVKWLGTCRVATLQSKPIPTGADLSSEDMPPRLRGGRLNLFEATYSCIGPNGSNADVPVSLMFKNDRVVQFMMGRPE